MRLCYPAQASSAEHDTILFNEGDTCDVPIRKSGTTDSNFPLPPRTHKYQIVKQHSYGAMQAIHGIASTDFTLNHVFAQAPDTRRDAPFPLVWSRAFGLSQFE
jgi:hypothetical protein